MVIGVNFNICNNYSKSSCGALKSNNEAACGNKINKDFSLPDARFFHPCLNFTGKAAKTGQCGIASGKSDAGTKENPVIIKLSEDASARSRTFKSKNGKYYTLIHNDEGNTSGLKIVYALQDAESEQSYLRSMQWNNGKLSASALGRLKEDYEDYSDTEEFPSFRDYAEYKEKELYKLIDREMAELSQVSPLEEDNIYWRGINLDKKSMKNDSFHYMKSDQEHFIDYMNNIKINDVIMPDWGIVCAACDVENTAGFYTNDALLRIKAPKGSKIARCSVNEVRFPSKSEFKVTDIKNYDGLKIIDLEYIVPDYENFD